MRLLTAFALCTAVSGASTAILAQERAPRLIALKDATTLAPVTVVASGQRLILTGQALLTPGVSARVHIAGRYVPGVQWHPERVELVAPAVSTTYRGDLSVLWYQGGGWQVMASLPGYMLQPGPPPLPEPFILPLEAGPPEVWSVQGTAYGRRTAPIAGDVTEVSGHGFGSVRGRLTWDGAAVTTVLWKETLIRFRLPGPLKPSGHRVQIVTSDGKTVSAEAFRP